MNEISFGKSGLLGANIAGKASRRSETLISQKIKREKEETRAWKKLKQQIKSTNINTKNCNKLDFLI